MSLKDIQEYFNNIIKPQLEEILELLSNIQAQDITGNIEAAAAKIITELKPLILDCQCNKENLEALQKLTGKEIITDDNLTDRPLRYSYPNFSVGNDDMGTGKNPGSLTWPFGDPEKSK
jgi:Caulimovirus DNA-binding protein